MIAYPDTSYLCAIYRLQDNSKAAATHFASLPEALHVTGLLLYEFRQSCRYQVWLHKQDRSIGYSKTDCDKALDQLEADLADGAVVVVPAEWAEVHSIAERLSAKYAPNFGTRAFDTLHVATALHLKASQFLSFDGRQRRVAKAEGLDTQPE